MTLGHDAHAPLAAAIVGSAALGAAAMYVFDPDKGRRRRALARDKATSLAQHANQRMGVSARDFVHRLQGLRSRSWRGSARDAMPDDPVLIERIRSRLGRVVSHPHAIQVGVHNGRVTLSGPILAAEVRPLERAIRSIRGVTLIDDRLDMHERAESIASLQGGVERPDAHWAVKPSSWALALGAVAIACGVFAALHGSRRF